MINIGGVSLNEILNHALSNFWGQITLLFRDINITDILDILLVTLLIYEVIVLVRNTRASQITKGIVLLIAAYVLVSLLNMRTMEFVLQSIMSFGIIVLAIIFQPELRRAMEQVGELNAISSRIFRPPSLSEAEREKWKKAIVAVCDASEHMAEERCGALIVLERSTNLSEVIRTGTTLRSEPNVEVLETIFFEGTPLHDGAVVVRDGLVEAAGCFLPLSNNLEISKDMGTRHRSALGMSESSDAIVVVVSEETGIISLAKNGVMIRRLDRQNLFNMLISDLILPVAEPQKKKRKRPKGEDA